MNQHCSIEYVLYKLVILTSSYHLFWRYVAVLLTCSELFLQVIQHTQYKEKIYIRGEREYNTTVTQVLKLSVNRYEEYLQYEKSDKYTKKINPSQ